MPIWQTKPVTEQPSITLEHWRIIETERNERHFVGYSPADREGRVSSAIQSFDPVTRRGVTRTGRVYALAGSPGIDSDAQYVLGCWVQINRVTALRDVTADVTATGPGTTDGQDAAVAAGPGTTEGQDAAVAAGPGTTATRQ
jgi:hypothetical protein